MNRHFSFKLKDEVVRGMNRQQYKKVHSYLRKLGRAVDETIDWDGLSKAIGNIVIYGQGKYEQA